MDRGAVCRCPGDFATLIQTEVTTERKTYAASGTLFGKQFLRSWCGSETICLTLTSMERSLIFTHMDRPGLIGFIGRTLGDEGVNIGQMNVGRGIKGAKRSAWSTSTVFPQAALENMRQNPNIFSLSLIKLPAAGPGRPGWGRNGCIRTRARRCGPRTCALVSSEPLPSSAAALYTHHADKAGRQPERRSLSREGSVFCSSPSSVITTCVPVPAGRQMAVRRLLTRSRCK